ncbi:MAG: Transcriptional regulator, AbrB family [Candidatus Giovannonibacteria bacterium GW2011_GWA2_45_21]|uniref:Transcriptional regulator, AbrB family n=1 Tax=Candidatus Giovannonibacteria bacterium GW2011_GWA2_45_21 TaxID=1618649 RepID=A0A0G1PEM9_9BACT|nr:MAG: Transcriptional regulator, AbrB family [Candidatus Giovannonibacteria bacterium GW2011_GWA2_45_21]
MVQETRPAPLVTIKTKYQVTLPTSIRRKADVSVGDILEAKVEGKKITLTPKSLIDRELSLALEDVKAGRLSPVFSTAEAGLRWLHAGVKKVHSKKPARHKT